MRPGDTAALEILAMVVAVSRAGWTISVIAVLIVGVIAWNVGGKDDLERFRRRRRRRRSGPHQ